MERAQDQIRSHGTPFATVDDLAAPGRASRTEQLVGPIKPRASGLIARKAASDGIAEGADGAIEEASRSSGVGLPADVMREFGASLGADLSSVRVHTGVVSATAARAVGAKAYTLGQDIHFGAGQYDPGSASGRHLLAHEVAHTRQQSAASPVVQHKLEISAPGDASELEADRAADAIMNGVTAQVSGATGLARQVIQRVGEELDIPVAIRGLPNPLDPYQQDPVAWNYPAAPGPAIPPSWTMLAPAFPAVLPRLDHDGKPTKIETADVETKAQADQTFMSDLGMVFSSWSTIASKIPAYRNAERDIGANGLGGGPGGLHWSPGTGSGDTGQLAEAQQVGPINGRQTTIGNLFDAQGALQSTPNVSEPQQRAIKQLYSPVDTALGGVATAQQGVKTATGLLSTAQSLQAEAIDSMSINKTTHAIDKDDALAADLAEQKASADLAIGAIAGTLSLLCNVPEGGLGLAGASVAAIGSVITFATDAAYDYNIETVQLDITRLQTLLSSLGDKYVTDKYATAANAAATAASAMKQAKLALKTACANYQDVWDAFARAAGQNVGGKDGAQLEAILEAIPRCEVVLAQVNQIVATASTLPTFTPSSGIGFNAALCPDAMPLHYAWLQGYQVEFLPLVAKWSARISSLSAAADAAKGTPNG